MAFPIPDPALFSNPGFNITFTPGGRVETVGDMDDDTTDAGMILDE